MGQLPDHLAAGAVLDQQGVFAADLRAARHVGNLDEQRGIVDIDRRYAAVNDALFVVDFGRRQAEFVGVLVTGCRDPTEYLAHFRLVVHEPQQRLAPGARTTDAEDVFGGRVEVDDQQVFVEENDARVEAVENEAGIFVKRSVTGTAAL